MNQNINIQSLNVQHKNTFMYIPPIIWKGDSVGHIGGNDTFFFVLEGECFLLIENEAAIIRPGQLAYLPKGKKRTYTHISERFVMYEMSFSVESEDKNLLELLGLTSGNYAVDIADREALSALFENSHRIELFKSPIYNIACCANLLNIIKMYAEARLTMEEKNNSLFDSVIKYMSESTDKNLTTEELSGIVFMQPTYFIRKFKESFGMSPQNYFRRLKLFKAMNLLASTELSIEEISNQIGIDDTSYFARFFKKECNVTPSEYRKAFRK